MQILDAMLQEILVNNYQTTSNLCHAFSLNFVANIGSSDMSFYFLFSSL